MAKNNRLLIALVAAGAVVVAAALGFWFGRGSSQAPIGVGAPAASAGEAGPVTVDQAPLTRSAQTAPPPESAQSTELGEAPALPARRPARSTRLRTASAQSGASALAPAIPAATAAEPEPEAPPQPQWVDVTIPQGTPIRIQLEDGVSSQSAMVGQAVTGRLAQSVIADGRVALPRGAVVHGEVTAAKALKKIGGQASLAIAFRTVEIEDHTVPIAAAFERTGKSETGKDAATIAGGAIIGTILGNQSSSSRGKLVGGLLGAAAGSAVAAGTKGEKVELPAGTELELHLAEPVQVSVPNR